MRLLALRSIRYFAMEQHDRIWRVHGRHVNAMADIWGSPYDHLPGQWGELARTYWALLEDMDEARRMREMAVTLVRRD